ncbi:hypothetical protein Q3G72_030672 [Acer saccharum]|nr:hypothetical protein Q3G72_030672 [Acer saccharum]
MSGLDVEALLDSTAAGSTNGAKHEDEDRYQNDRSERRDRDRYRDGSRDRDRDRKRRDRSRDRDHRKDRDDDLRSPRSDRGSVTGSHKTDAHALQTILVVDRKTKTPEPQLTEDERDRRTVFVQQLAARLRTKELIQFFEKIGPVKEAQIVKDRVSGRSKGLQIMLTNGNQNSIPFHRLYVGNIHFSITEQDLQNVFDPFGELEFVQLQKEEQGRSRGYGFVQFRDPDQAREALEKMNGFWPFVGLGNDKFTPESTANLLQRFQGQDRSNYQGSAFSGSGGRGAHAGGSGGTFDKAGGRDDQKGAQRTR